MLLYVKPSQGFALIAVLIFMQILALFSWYVLADVLLEIKMNREVMLRYFAVQQADQWLNQAEFELLKQLPHCLLPVTTSAVLLNQPLAWWESSITCAGHFYAFRYYYVVEYLREDPCAYVEATKVITAYYRITLLGIFKANNTKVFLQSTLARPVKSSQQCNGLYRSVKLGRQTWREI